MSYAPSFMHEVFDALIGSDVPGPSRMVLLALAEHQGYKSSSYPSAARLMACTGLGRNTVLRAVTDLEARGCLQVERKRGSGSVYMVRPVPEWAHPGTREVPVPERDRSQSGTTLVPERAHPEPREVPVPEWDRSQSGTTPVPERDHTGPTLGYGTRKEPKNKDKAPPSSSKKAPTVHPLLQHFMSEYQRLLCLPYKPANWGRETQVMKRLAEAYGDDRVREAITAYLAGGDDYWGERGLPVPGLEQRIQGLVLQRSKPRAVETLTKEQRFWLEG